MVSLDTRNQFIDDLRSADSSCFTLALVFDEDRPSAEPATVSDRASIAIISDNKVEFTKVVHELESRKIKADADWVLDDFLLFALLVGSQKFQCGDGLCKAIISKRRPTNDLDIAFNDAMRSLSQGAIAIEGAFAFTKLVFCELTGQLRIDKSVVQTVYKEVTRLGCLSDLATFPRLLAYRAFDLLIFHGIVEEMSSVDAIVDAIQERSEKMSIGDWVKIGMAMRPSVIAWIVGCLVALATASFSAGVYIAPNKVGNATEKSQIPDTTNKLPSAGKIETNKESDGE